MSRKLILLLLLAIPLTAQDAPLFIERIEVRNHKYVSPHVVISESRLYEGRAYSEAELRDAATRLGRLPFLLSVDFSLEKGSERGKHVLVLTIQETKPFFYLIDAVPYFDESPYVDIEYDDRPGLNEEDLVLGYRRFVGRRGAVHIAFTGAGSDDRPFTNEYASFIAGYTQYDLFGTRAFATLSLKRPIEGHGEGRITPQFVLGIPLSVNQTVTLELDETRFRGEVGVFELGSESRSDQRLLSARWTYNTTNEPFFPTRGTLLSVAPHYGWSDGVNIIYPDGQTPRAFAEHSQGYGMRVNGTRFSELSERSSVWGDLRADWAQDHYRNELNWEWTSHAWSAGVGAGYAFSLWSADERARGDSRFELTARYAYRGDLEYASPYFPRDPNVFQTNVAWVRRSSWGTLRLGVGYAW